MPAPKPADMEECTPKLRCTQGDYIGVAYDPTDPCPEGTTFNVDLCQCDNYEPCDCSCDNDCGECEICDEATGVCSPLPPPSCNSDCCVQRRVMWTRDDGNGGREQTGGINEYKGAYIAGSPEVYTQDTQTCVQQLIGYFDNSDSDCSSASFLPVTFCGGGTIATDNWELFIANQYNGSGRNDCPCEGPDFPGREEINQNYGYCPGDGDYQP